jgi:large subunit ribosomal protein L6
MSIAILYNKNINKYENFNNFIASVNNNNTDNISSHYKNDLAGLMLPFTKVLIIKGIGYQAEVVELNSIKNEFLYNKYLSLRVGHSFNLYKPIPNFLNIKVLHKDRKIIIEGYNKKSVSNFSKIIFKLRPPSVYTGRGIRIKKGNHKRKLGKKDIKKGKI